MIFIVWFQEQHINFMVSPHPRREMVAGSEQWDLGVHQELPCTSSFQAWANIHPGYVARSPTWIQASTLWRWPTWSQSVGACGEHMVECNEEEGRVSQSVWSWWPDHHLVQGDSPPKFLLGQWPTDHASFTIRLGQCSAWNIFHPVHPIMPMISHTVIAKYTITLQ